MTSPVIEALRRFAGLEPVPPAQSGSPDVPQAPDDVVLRRLFLGLQLCGDASVVVADAAAALRRDAPLRDAVARRLAWMLTARRHRYLHADVGVLEPTGFLRTLRSRLGERLLPHVPQPDLLRDLMAQVFSEPALVAWVCRVPQYDWAALVEVLLQSPDLVPAAQHSGHEADAALTLLAARAAGLAADPERLRYQRRVEAGVADTAADAAEEGAVPAPAAGALGLPGVVHAWLQARRTDSAASPRELLRQLAAAMQETARLRASAATHGTTMSLTHALHAGAQTLARMRELVLLRTASDAAERARRVAASFVHLVEAQSKGLRLRDVVARASEEVAQQITEHASRTGEHYVTDHRSQWWSMLRAAAGAGVIVGFMALLKVFIAGAHLPPLWETLAVCLNYGLGFVLIHLLHFTVATKQPAMTATLLAARLGQEDASPAGAARLADLIVRTVRTQVVAIVGNVALAVPTSCLIFLMFQWLTGAGPVPAAKAQAMLHDVQPHASLALPHAAIAGVCLFVAGVISGYYDNLCIFGRVGDRLAAHPLVRRWAGRERALRLGAFIEGNLGALLGNLSFGFLLGGVGFIGFLTGLPLDIRHVAFASANTAYGLLTLHGQVPWSTALTAVAGVGLVATVNVLVSYALAFVTAFRARRVRYDRAGLVIDLVLRRLLRRPQDFFWPPRQASGTPESGTQA